MCAAELLRRHQIHHLRIILQVVDGSKYFISKGENSLAREVVQLRLLQSCNALLIAGMPASFALSETSHGSALLMNSCGTTPHLQ
jgi:hypothetical protein